MGILLGSCGLGGAVSISFFLNFSSNHPLPFLSDCVLLLLSWMEDKGEECSYMAELVLF